MCVGHSLLACSSSDPAAKTSFLLLRQRAVNIEDVHTVGNQAVLGQWWHCFETAPSNKPLLKMFELQCKERTARTFILLPMMLWRLLRGFVLS